ncbi:unnamed protein product [Kuraishia capsulata CBS 1993]|uniref:Zn(2)-C6 fungal-type domain-containing protein n=1 Tax=Kuraishia capsulata CBS 1993 TaxID=1382522 RepID=W6MXK7_9ASCO|nr:uncharacterized protein KUCA_T00005047001 [Kuraishia capsulata CBS 1993]CDK29060.1 unnamed protein product [Kuraishia capsulata CBS 1993]
MSDDRKRTKRACDLCNQKRVKCDGELPVCRQCQRSGSICSYNREEKKRGRASARYPKTIIRRKPTKRELQLRLRPVTNSIELPDLSECRYRLLGPFLSEITALGISVRLACDLYEHYFSQPPLYSIGPILRPRRWLVPMGETGPTAKPDPDPRYGGTTLQLILAILLTSLCDIGHPFFLGAIKRDMLSACYQRILELLPVEQSLSHTTAKSDQFDDVVVFAMLSGTAPLITRPHDSLEWAELGCRTALRLRINHELPQLESISEEDREERRRAWWCLVVTANYLGGVFNTRPAVDESQSTQLYRPCAQDLWIDSKAALIPASLDPKRLRGLDLAIQDGVYGWLLPFAIVLGRIDCLAADRFENPDTLVDPMAQSRCIQQLAILESTLIAAHDSGRVCEMDYLMCQLYTTITYNAARRSRLWDPQEVFEHPFPIDELDDKSWLFAAIDILNKIYTANPTMREQSLTRGFFLFMLGIELLACVDSVASVALAKTERVTRLRFAANLAMRTMESLNAYITTDYLRLLVTYMRDSLRDLDNLVLLNDYDEELAKNRARRKHGISVFSWREGGTGISI